jgi:uncharacterized membrane protein
MEYAELFMEGLASWVKLAFEVGSVTVVAIGGLVAILSLVSKRSLKAWLASMRPELSGYLLVALELQLAADIVGTALAPSWEQLGKLAVIAAIRTFLNFFLEQETKETATLDS